MTNYTSFQSLEFLIFNINKSQKPFSNTYDRLRWSGSHNAYMLGFVKVLYTPLYKLNTFDTGSQDVIFMDSTH